MSCTIKSEDFYLIVELNKSNSLNFETIFFKTQ